MGDVEDGADFDGAPFCAGDLAGDGERFVEVVDIDDVVAAELFVGFGEGAVGDEALAAAHADASRGGGGMQGGGGDELAVRGEFVHELGGFFVAGDALALAEGIFVAVDEEHVLHFASVFKFRLQVASSSYPNLEPGTWNRSAISRTSIRQIDGAIRRRVRAGGVR
ncbi:MAG: hypothetical protein U0232_25995 [Thermomicrobiales bacterium]